MKHAAENSQDRKLSQSISHQAHPQTQELEEAKVRIELLMQELVEKDKQIANLANPAKKVASSESKEAELVKNLRAQVQQRLTSSKQAAFDQITKLQ